MPVINVTTWFTDIISRLLVIVVWPVFLGAVVLMFIYAGFLFLTAQGEPGKITDAKKAAIWAIVGIIVAIVAFSAYGLIYRIILGVAPPGGGEETCLRAGMQCSPMGSVGGCCAPYTCKYNRAIIGFASCY